MKRMICAALTALLTLGLLPSALAAEESGGSFDRFAVVSPETYRQFTDIDESKWYGAEQQGVIQRACDLGILHGMEASRFLPEGNLRVSEAIKIACVVHGIYTTGQADAVQPQPGKNWAAPYIAYALEQGIIREGDFADYGAYATRAQMAYIFAHSLPEEGLETINTIASITDVDRCDTFPIQYAEEIFSLYRAGVLMGEEGDHAFRPEALITRAETAAIVARLVTPAERQHFEILTIRGFVGACPDYGIVNPEGNALCLGQQPYEDLLAFEDGEPLKKEVLESEGERWRVTATYQTFEIAYFIGKVNPTDIYIASLKPLASEIKLRNGLALGDTEEALLAAYGEDDLIFQGSWPVGDFGYWTEPGYSYFPADGVPWCSINYTMTEESNGSIKEIHLGCTA